MKKNIILLLLTISNYCNGQNIDNLKKYSYILIAKKDNKAIGNSTCFFVRHCGIVSVVSNFHALLDRNIDYSPLKELSFTSISIRHESKNGKTWEYTEIPISVLYKDAAERTKNFTIPLRMDAWTYRLQNLSEYPINFIDIDNNSTNDLRIKDGTKTIFWGFPAGDFKSEKNYTKREARYREGSLKSYSNLPNGKSYSNFYIITNAGGGFSGSPIFSVYKENGVDKIKFSGILYAGGSDAPNSDLSAMAFKADALISTLFGPCY
jgi:hypothetical protein